MGTYNPHTSYNIQPRPLPELARIDGDVRGDVEPVLSGPAAAEAASVPIASNPARTLTTLLKETAAAVGVDVVDLATVISYETAGTFNPIKRGPTTQWGQHKGLIQWGEPQAVKYGVDWNNPLASQLGKNGAIVRYLKDAGFKKGMGMLDLYSAINAGQVGRYNASDANNGGAPGTVRDKVEGQMAGHRAKAVALLNGEIELREDVSLHSPADGNSSFVKGAGGFNFKTQSDSVDNTFKPSTARRKGGLFSNLTTATERHHNSILRG